MVGKKRIARKIDARSSLGTASGVGMCFFDSTPMGSFDLDRVGHGVDAEQIRRIIDRHGIGAPAGRFGKIATEKVGEGSANGAKHQET